MDSLCPGRLSYMNGCCSIHLTELKNTTALRVFPAGPFCIGIILFCLERFELCKGIAEYLRGRQHRLRTCHIHSGNLKHFDGMQAAPAAEKFAVIPDRRLTQRENAVCNCSCRRNSRRILINIECSIEMRNSFPFIAKLRVNCKPLPIILPVQLTVQSGKFFGQERLSFFHPLMRLLFKGRKHCLPVKGRAQVVELLIKQETLLFLGGGVPEQVIAQELLVQRGGNLCTKNTISRVDIGLIPAAKIGVHRMSQFMCQRKDIVQRPGKV